MNNQTIKSNKLIPLTQVESKIYRIRGQKVMVDEDLAYLYGVKTQALNQAVKRNYFRFPSDFMFQLTEQEALSLTSQIVISNRSVVKLGRGGRRFLPYVFTEQGIAMLSSVLRSKKAAEVNIAIMRAFVRLRRVLAANKDLTYLFKELKGKVNQHDVEIGLIIRTIEKMIAIEKKPKEKFGFAPNR